jgi:hypothetical protein
MSELNYSHGVQTVAVADVDRVVVGDQDAGSPAQAFSVEMLDGRKGSPEAFKRSFSEQEGAPRTELEVTSKFGSAKLRSAEDAGVAIATAGMIGGLQLYQLSRPQVQPIIAANTFGAQLLVFAVVCMYFRRHPISKHRL